MKQIRIFTGSQLLEVVEQANHFLMGYAVDIVDIKHSESYSEGKWSIIVVVIYNKS